MLLVVMSRFESYWHEMQFFLLLYIPNNWPKIKRRRINGLELEKYEKKIIFKENSLKTKKKFIYMTTYVNRNQNN